MKFSDGSTISLTGALTVKGVLGQSSLYATSLSDQLIASSWDETLVGGLGDDTYRFSGSFGLDTIRDRTFTLGGSGNDSIAISGVSAASVRVSRSSQNDDLVVSVVNSLGTEISSVTIDGQFSGNVNDVIESLKIGSAAASTLLAVSPCRACATRPPCSAQPC